MSGPRRPYDHVLRMAGLFVLGISAFFVLRALFVPDDFGVYGHYRAAALELNRDKPLVHAGQAACAQCHPDIVESRAGSRHERLGCEGCHAPAGDHASGNEQAAKPPRPNGRAACLGCHAKSASKPLAFPQVIAAEHAAEGTCTTCHNPHHPKVS